MGGDGNTKVVNTKRARVFDVMLIDEPTS